MGSISRISKKRLKIAHVWYPAISTAVSEASNEPLSVYSRSLTADL